MSKRLFIAIKPNSETLASLKSFQDQLKQDLPYPGIRWVKPALLHITLQFLGETENSNLDDLTSNLQVAVKDMQSFDLIFEGIGYFGSANSVRVIWTGTKKSSGLQTLYDKVRRASSFLDLEQKPRFSPHITLARVSDRVSTQESINISNHINTLRPPFFGSKTVDSIDLVESTLLPAGPVYKTYRTFNFG